MSNVETRRVQTPIKLRAAGQGAAPNRLVGFAAMYGLESLPLHDDRLGGEFVEVIAPGAFARTLRENPDIRALYNHDTNIVLGRTRSGTLKLTDLDIGLAFVVELPDTQAARDVKALVARGDVNGCSFGFVVVNDRIEARQGKPPLRTLLDIDLHEISPAVAFPAYEGTSVAVRARARASRAPGRDERLRRLRHLEMQLRIEGIE